MEKFTNIYFLTSLLPQEYLIPLEKELGFMRFWKRHFFFFFNDKHFMALIGTKGFKLISELNQVYFILLDYLFL